MNAPAPTCLDDPARASRAAVVDLGSNSVRLVVFEGGGRNPVVIFNEKAVLGLGRGFLATGQLNEAAVGPALTILARYGAVAEAMGAAPMAILATAAMRDAGNGAAFAEAVRERLPGVGLQVLSGREEAALSAEGVLLGFPAADGILGDIGGGSLEVVDLAGGRAAAMESLPLGVIRLCERAGGEVGRARAVAEADLARLPWLSGGAGRDLYLVGGAWRALAKVHMARAGYPLSIVNHYVLGRDAARELCAAVTDLRRPALDRLPGAPSKRAADLPYAAVVLRRLLRATGARRVVFSANGLREGWYARRLDPAVRALDPMLAAARELSDRFGRGGALPPALIDWTAPLFAGESAAERALREAACWLSDTGSHDHPDYRAEQALLRVLRQPGVGLGHGDRAFLALTVALRYEAEPDAATAAVPRALLDPSAQARAVLLGAALRLAYTLSGGTPDLLSRSGLEVSPGRLLLRLHEGGGVFAGEAVQRRADTLAALLGARAELALAA